MCLQRNLYAEAKASYHFEYAEIHDSVLLNYCISHFIVVPPLCKAQRDENLRSRLAAKHFRCCSVLCTSIKKSSLNTKQGVKKKPYLCCFDHRMNVMSPVLRFNNTSRHALQAHEEQWSVCEIMPTSVKIRGVMLWFATSYWMTDTVFDSADSFTSVSRIMHRGACMREHGCVYVSMNMWWNQMQQGDNGFYFSLMLLVCEWLSQISQGELFLSSQLPTRDSNSKWEWLIG